MKVIITGYGRMGHEVEAILRQRNHEILCRVDSSGCGDAEKLSRDILDKCDGVIEFSLPEGIVHNTSLYAECGVPAVVGTTGWDDKKAEIQGIVEKSDSALLWGSNFSLGAHMLFILAEKASALINNLPEYDAMICEYHHKLKKDSPSGTALTLAEKVLENLDRKTEVMPEKLDREIKPEELHVASVRGGNIPGIHTLTLDSLADSVEITHTARNRSGFALGSVLALEWLQDKKGFFRVEDFIRDFF